MANAVYTAGRQKFLEGAVAWLTDTIKAVATDHAVDTPNVATDDFLDDIALGARVATSSALTGKTSTGGVADANDVTFASVPVGPAFESISLFKDTGTEATSPLLAYLDTITGLPCTPGGGDITLVFDDGANKVFKL